MILQKRLQGIDLLKCIAIFTIPAQHFFSHQTHFRDAIYDTVSMFIQSVGLEFFLMGVPLFIAITGFLSHQTQPTWAYYRKSLKVLVPYLLISVIYILFRNWHLNESIGIRHGLGMILRVNAIPYAWYVEMWIGLYFLAPFLNILYEGITSRKTSIILIATLYVMSYLTSTVNRHGFQFLPDYWVSISPLASYFIGSHIRKFGTLVPRKRLVVFILVAILAEPIINLLFFPGQVYRFILGTVMLIVPAMAALFLLLYQWNTPKRWLQRMLAAVSNLTLEMYLYCALCDMVLYPFFLQWFQNQSQFGLFFFVIIPLELAATFCIAWITNKAISITHIDRLWQKRK